MEPPPLSDLSHLEGRDPTTRRSLQGDSLSRHPPSELSTRYRGPSDPLSGEVAAQAQTAKLRAPGLLLDSERYRSLWTKLGTSAKPLETVIGNDRELRDATICSIFLRF